MAPSYVVVDGSNIATEGRSVPSLAQLDEAVRQYQAEFPGKEVIVVVDATFGHRIDPSERKAFDEAVSHAELVSPPAGAVGRGDAFLLRVAERVGAEVLSNDSFQEFHADHPWLFDADRLIGGKPVPGAGVWIFTPRSPVRGVRSRAALAVGSTKSNKSTRAAKSTKSTKSAASARAAKTTKRAAVDSAASSDEASTLDAAVAAARVDVAAPATKKTKKAAKIEKAAKKSTKATQPADKSPKGKAAKAPKAEKSPGTHKPDKKADKAQKTDKKADKAPKADKAQKPRTTGAAADDASGGSASRGRRGRGRRATAPDVRAAIDVATVEAVAPEGDAVARVPSRRRRAAAPPAVNDPLTFLTFVSDHPVGSTIEGTVVAFVSHGAMVDVGGMQCYVPLAGLAVPAPSRAREVLERGQHRPFVLVALDPARRGAELALPEVAAAANQALTSLPPLPQ